MAHHAWQLGGRSCPRTLRRHSATLVSVADEQSLCCCAAGVEEGTDARACASASKRKQPVTTTTPAAAKRDRSSRGDQVMKDDGNAAAR
jgi:hypothetical protein